ncbi:UPF0187 protein alr2987 [Erysiphe neolycopersici]|uniref:UPF0187 protein alr2987 n=1 Tax=Erysiphe neolycopersici TaxID=212602 RepID=A0A420HXM1_9PEZI|nr:UPF0187 protein alr2987 [Erysiphe neolycopersici]
MTFVPASAEDGKAVYDNNSEITMISETQSNRSSIYYGSSRVATDAYARYFQGPRDINSHSKYPLFLRVHGSVMPRMFFPIFCLGCWATVITYICKHYLPLTAEPLLVTVLGLVVGLSLSFRSSTAYERYSEGRKAWATLLMQSRTLARFIWVHIPEKRDTESEPDGSRSDLITKISAINLIYAFAIALKHRLRFQPYTDYADLAPLIGHLETYAKYAQDSRYHSGEIPPGELSIWKKIGESLSLSFAISNPRKAINSANAPLGNLPQEILTYLSTFIHEAATENPGPSSISTSLYSQLLNCVVALTDVQTQADRILSTPLPLGYNILISQLVFLYTYLLPFQLEDKLGWITVPATLAASYIIIGIAAIGNELENPFGNDVNDLPLDNYCHELRQDLDCLVSKKPVKFREIIRAKGNMPLWPLCTQDFDGLFNRKEKEIRDVLKAKAYISKDY